MKDSAAELPHENKRFSPAPGVFGSSFVMLAEVAVDPALNILEAGQNISPFASAV